MPRGAGIITATWVGAPMQRPRGTRDFAPQEAYQRRVAGEGIRATFERFGYREVQTPTFEELELFTAKSGDGIIKELYDFTDKGDRRLTLRPELTAPVMRMYHEAHQFDPKPLKWYYFGNCFRYDRPQEGRYREFWQFGCEQIGAGTPLAYAELIALGDAVMRGAGLQEVDLQVGHVAILRAVVDALGLDDEARGQLMRLVDKADRDAAATHLEENGVDGSALFALLDATDLETARAAAAHEGLEELAATLAFLESFGVKARLNLGIARGLDYYNGIVFEAHSPALGGQSQLLGGGGYDLAKVFGGQSTPTMGFGLGFDRLLVALEKEGATTPAMPGPAIYLGGLSEAGQAKAVEVATRLRNDGVAVELDLAGRKPGAIAKHADAVGAQVLVLIGDRDLESGTVSLKHLASGDKRDVPIADLHHEVLVGAGTVDLMDYN